VKCKVSELTGAALDWAVAECIYEPDDVVICNGRVFAYDDAIKGFNPPTNWAQGGLIIEREKIALKPIREWMGSYTHRTPLCFRSTRPNPTHCRDALLCRHQTG
jgi:hypothetical protein